MKHNDTARLRAEHALDAIEKYARRVKGEARTAYLAYVKSLPATIRSNGLGQALAMLLARAGQDTEAGQGGRAPSAYRDLYQHLEAWFQHGNCPQQPRVAKLARDEAGASARPLLKVAMAASQSDYLLMQAEASLYVEWLKKFANAALSKEAEPNAQAAQTGAAS